MPEEGIVSSVEFQMSLLLFVALAGYLIAYKINQSAVVGVILAGIVVGPSVLNIVTVTDLVSSLGRLGAVVLLFTIGLHFRIRDIANLRYAVIALFGVLLPWAGGFYLAELFDFSYGGAIFVGTALTATSIAITANVLKEMDRLDTAAARAIIGAAIIDDVLSLLALSVSEQIVAGDLSFVFILTTLGKAVGFLVLGTILGTTALRRMVLRLDRSAFCEKYPESIFILAVMVAFLYSMIAELVGLSAIIGSFLAGVSLSQVRLEHGDVFRGGAEHLQIIFASIFFISLGVLLDFHIITASLLWFIVALTAVAILTKVLGCGIPAVFQRMGLRDSLTIGVGMVPRGEVAMIVALIGLSQGLIEQDTYAALILMSLLTTIIPPLVLRNWLFRRTSPHPTVACNH